MGGREPVYRQTEARCLLVFLRRPLLGNKAAQRPAARRHPSAFHPLPVGPIFKSLDAPRHPKTIAAMTALLYTNTKILPWPSTTVSAVNPLPTPSTPLSSTHTHTKTTKGRGLWRLPRPRRHAGAAVDVLAAAVSGSSLVISHERVVISHERVVISKRVVVGRWWWW